jgi:hypothetical protein
MDALNVESYLGCNYGRYSLVTYRSVKKFYLRIQSVKLDIYYLKSCRSKDIIPGFLQFKTANRNLASSPEYKESQRRLLNAEINYKHQHLRNCKRSYEASYNTLQESCPEPICQRLQEIIITVCKPILNNKKTTIEKKLHKLGFYNEPKSMVDRKVVKNLSTKTLSEDKIDCLAHGLDYGLLPKRFDNMNAIGNIERFFHRVTDVFQKQKKFRAEMKDKDQVVQNDIRFMDTKQLTLACNLRSLTDSFRSQANQYQKQQLKFHSKQIQYHELLKELKEDKSIVITRPDKGKGVVILDKDDYISKMNTILNDTTKFECLSEDPTISRETSLTNLLRRLKNKGYISEDFYDMARPTGSNPGRLYGLPKIHKVKEGIPLRPVLSSIGTYNYGLAKVLKQMLSVMVENETLVKNSFRFIEDLKSLPKSASSYQMVSFDIVSLYTNIPINETIELILDYLYNDQLPTSVMKRLDMKKLLEFATKHSHFLFNGKIYDQKDGVSMGSPLAPLLAEIFLQNFERNHLPAFREMGIIYWKRYVDDTFVLLDPEVSAKDICERLSQCHPSLKFTVEEERLEGHTIPFLNVLIQRLPGVGFRTRVYRKSTFSGLLTKWDSFVPKTYKYNAISTMAYIATRICSTYTALHNEFKFIRKIALKNGYPLAFIESIIKKQLNLVYTPRVVTPPEPETDITVLRIPYYGKPSQIYAKRVTAAVAQQYLGKKIRVVYDVTTRIGRNFTTKDEIPTEIKSGVVYEAACSQCTETYIGKTYRHLKTRINEHLSDLTKNLPPPKPSDNQLNQNPQVDNIILAHNHHMTTRSQTRINKNIENQRKLLPKQCSLPINNDQSNAHKLQKKTQTNASHANKAPTISAHLQKTVVDGILLNTIPAPNPHNLIPKSALAKHYVATGHLFTNKDFKILLTDQQRFRLHIKESLLIKQKQPQLNRTERSLPLYIYPDGIQKTNNNQSNQTAGSSFEHMDPGI